MGGSVTMKKTYARPQIIANHITNVFILTSSVDGVEIPVEWDSKNWDI